MNRYVHQSGCRRIARRCTRMSIDVLQKIRMFRGNSVDLSEICSNSTNSVLTYTGGSCFSLPLSAWGRTYALAAAISVFGWVRASGVL